MQLLSNQMLTQSQNCMFLQQQQVLQSNAMNNSYYRQPQVPWVEGFNQGFNTEQPQQFYHRPTYDPGIFYQVPITHGFPNTPGYVFRHPAEPAKHHNIHKAQPFFQSKLVILNQ